MFQIEILTDSWHKIYGDGTESSIINPVMNQKLNGCGSVSFSVSMDDEYYNEYEQFKTKVRVSEAGALLFVGRLLDINKDFYGTKSFLFEGEMSYFNDVQFPPFEYKGTIAGFFDQIINHYNSHCSEDNMIQRGRITVTDSNNYISRSNEDYSNCWECLNDKLIKLCGGYMQLRWVITDNEVYRYLDYLENPGSESTQTIEFGENILNISSENGGDDIVTVLIPFGAKDEETGQRVNISSVNPTGKNYIVSSKYRTYGLIEHVEYWDDVTLPANLYNKALLYLAEHDKSITTLTVDAIDLHAVDVDIPRLNVGDTVHVKSLPHGIDLDMMITERVRNLDDASKDKFTIGKKIKTFTSSVDSNGLKVDVNIDEYIEEIKREVIEEVEDLIPDDEHIKSLAEQQTDILLGGKGGYFEVLYEDEENPQKPTGFRLMDTDSDATALNVILMDKNGLGFSNNGVNGPFYNAWTIDGRLTADVIATGVLQDRQKNFVLDLDTGTISVNKLTLNTPDLIFGEVNNQYIEVKDYESNNPECLIGDGNVYTYYYSDAVVSSFEIVFELTEYDESVGLFGSFLIFRGWDGEEIYAFTGTLNNDKLYIEIANGNQGAETIIFNDIKLNTKYTLIVDSTTVKLNEASQSHSLAIPSYCDSMYLHWVSYNEGTSWLYWKKFTGKIYKVGVRNTSGQLMQELVPKLDGDVPKFYKTNNNTYAPTYGGTSYRYEGKKVGVVFDGTGKIFLKPEGEFIVENYKDGVIYNELYLRRNSDHEDNEIGIFNKKYSLNGNANSLSMFARNNENNTNIHNYHLNNTYTANFISLSSNESKNELRIENLKYGQDYLGNFISLSTSTDLNEMSLNNYVSGNTGHSELEGLANLLKFYSSDYSRYVNIQNFRRRSDMERQFSNELSLYSSDESNSIDIRNYDTTDETPMNFLYMNSKSGITLYNRWSHLTMNMGGDCELLANNTLRLTADHYDLYIETKEPADGHGDITIKANKDVKITAINGSIYLDNHRIYFSNNQVRYY